MTAIADEKVILDPLLASLGSGIPVRTIQRWDLGHELITAAHIPQLVEWLARRLR